MNSSVSISPDKQARIDAALLSFACGDALGMATEFMTRDQIERAFPDGVTRLLSQKDSQNHGNLTPGSVTDDTEQVAYLLERYRAKGQVTVADTVDALLVWIRETRAVEKHYIGPSSLKALTAIENGADPATAGTGTTCGGIMRIPAAVCFDPDQTMDRLRKNVRAALLPTHNTSEALEASGCYGAALLTALNGGTVAEVVEAALENGPLTEALAPWRGCAASSAARIREAASWGRLPDEELFHRLYDLWGTGLPSVDVCGAVFALFLAAEGSAYRAISLGASLGGDTDTIAALAGALTAAQTGHTDIPDHITGPVRAVNGPILRRLGL